MYIEDCVITVKLDDKNRIRLPKALGAGPDLDFAMFKNKLNPRLYLVPSLTISSFNEGHKTAQLLALIKQDSFCRILIPKRLHNFLPDRKQLTFEIRNDLIEITNNRI